MACYVMYVAFDVAAFSRPKKLLKRGMGLLMRPNVALALIEQSNQGSLPPQLDDAAGAFSYLYNITSIVLYMYII